MAITQRRHALVFCRIAHLTPARMIAILLACARVTAGGLEMSLRVGADPHLRVRRWNRQRIETPYLLGRLDASSPGSKYTDALFAHRRVIPGLNDSHLHVIRGGLNYNLELRWDGVPSLADGLRMGGQ